MPFRLCDELQRIYCKLLSHPSHLKRQRSSKAHKTKKQTQPKEWRFGPLVVTFCVVDMPRNHTSWWAKRICTEYCTARVKIKSSACRQSAGLFFISLHFH